MAAAWAPVIFIGLLVLGLWIWARESQRRKDLEDRVRRMEHERRESHLPVDWVRCPSCGELGPPAANFCPACGIDFG